MSTCWLWKGFLSAISEWARTEAHGQLQNILKQNYSWLNKLQKALYKLTRQCVQQCVPLCHALPRLVLLLLVYHALPYISIPRVSALTWFAKQGLYCGKLEQSVMVQLFIQTIRRQEPCLQQSADKAHNQQDWSSHFEKDQIIKENKLKRKKTSCNLKPQCATVMFNCIRKRDFWVTGEWSFTNWFIISNVDSPLAPP